MEGISCIVVIVILVLLGGLSFLGFVLISHVLTSELFLDGSFKEGRNKK